MKHKNSKETKNVKSKVVRVKRQSIFMPVSTTILFKFIVLLAILIVASIAVILRIFEPVVWTFLGILAGSVALSNNPLDDIQKINEKPK